MKKVRFIVDYRGVLTGEIFYEAGRVAEFEDGRAARLVKDGRARYVRTRSKKTNGNP